MKNIVCALIISLIIPTFAGATIYDIQVSNNTSVAVTISWVSDSDTTGEVHYSETKNHDLSNPSTAYDVRGQAFVGCTHYIDIKKLEKETTYYFEVVSGDEVDNNNWCYHTFKTMKEAFYIPCTLYGFVKKEDGTTPAENAIVYLWLTHGGVDSYLLSKLIPSNGSFVFDIKAARSVVTYNIFPTIDNGDRITVEAVYGCNYIASDKLVFDGCNKKCVSLTLEYSPSSTITSTTTSSTSSTTIETTTSTISPTTIPTTIPSTIPTTIPIITDTTSTTTTVESTTSSTTSTSPTTSTIIPTPECKVTINPPSANILPWGTLKFNASTSCDEKDVIGTYKWYVDSTSRSRIDENGLYKAGAFAGTDTVTVIDTANGDIEARAVVTISPLWPMAYEEMWGNKKGETLSLLRRFRDEVLANNEMGRDYIFMLYNNSLEILILLFQNPSLTKETKKAIDELLPGIQSILNGVEMILSKKQLADIESLLTKFESKATPSLKTAIKKVRRDMREGKVFEQLKIQIVE